MKLSEKIVRNYLKPKNLFGMIFNSIALQFISLDNRSIILKKVALEEGKSVIYSNVDYKHKFGDKNDYTFTHVGMMKPSKKKGYYTDRLTLDQIASLVFSGFEILGSNAVKK